MSAKPGMAFLALGLLVGASYSFPQAAADTQQQIQSHTQKAQAFLREKRPDLAIPELESLLALDPGNADAQGNLGVLLFFANKYEEAIPHLRAAVAAQPSLAKIRGLLGIAERNTGKPEAAEDDLAGAFPLIEDPKFKVQIGMQLVELYTASSDQGKAVSILVQLRRVDPENPEVIYATYRIYSDLAGESMLTLSLVAPASAQMHQVLAHEATRQGNLNGAIAQYRKAIAIDPNLPGVHFELAELLNTADDPRAKQEALPQYQEALKQSPLDAKVQCRLGEIYTRQGDLQKADSYYAKAVESHPDNAEANFGLAKTLIAMGQKQKALPVLEYAVQLEPTDAAAHYRLSTLYREQGRSEDAKRELAQYMKYKQLKEKLRDVYRELQIQPEQIRADDGDEKQ